MKISYYVELYYNNRYTPIWKGNNKERAIITANKSYNTRHGKTRVIKETTEIIYEYKK